MQPVDQEIGVFIQNYVKKRFAAMEREYNNTIRKGKHWEKNGLPQMRLWFMYILRDCLLEMRLNRTKLIKHSWKTSGLLLSLDGRDDIANEKALVHGDDIQSNK